MERGSLKGGIEGRTKRGIYLGKSGARCQREVVGCETESAYLLLPHIPPVLFFLDLLLLRAIPAQARLFQSLLVRVGTSADGGDAIDRIISDVDVT